MIAEEYQESKKTRLPRPVAFTLSDELAGGQFHYKNFLVDELKSKFPDNSRMWYVDKMYPYCDSGILHIDEPVSAEEIDLCILKSKFLKEKEIRYVYISHSMDIIDCIKQMKEDL